MAIYKEETETSPSKGQEEMKGRVKKRMIFAAGIPSESRFGKRPSM